MAQLTLVTGRGPASVVLAAPGVTVGRGRDCEVTIKDAKASRQHCRLEPAAGGWVCRDLDSQNGTRVNGVPVRSHVLEPGDRIEIGTTAFRFDAGAVAAPPEATAERERRQLLELARLVAAFNAALDPERLLPLILDSAIELTGAERGFIMLRTADGWSVPAARAMDASDVDAATPGASRSIAERVFSEDRPLCTDDASADARVCTAQSVQERRLRSVACVPLRVAGTPAGVLYLDNPFQRAIFTEADLRVLGAFADHAGVALQTARLVEAVGRADPAAGLGGARGGLALLGVVGRLAQSDLEFGPLAETLAGLLLEALDADRAAVVLRDPSGGLHTVAHGRPGRAVAGAQLLSTGIVDAALAGGTTVCCDDVAGDPRFRDRGSVRDLAITSAIAVPLVGVGPKRAEAAGVEGALYVDRSGPARTFGAADARWLEQCAERVARPLENARRYQRQAAEVHAVRREFTRTLDDLTARVGYGRCIGDHPAMRAVYDALQRLRGSTAPVLLLGESGTGKELVARILHQQSPRRDAPFHSENCAALADSVLAAELFGHVAGAFTGADRDREGLLAHADGGTLFLDECGEMSPALQGGLLRALAEGRFRPLGATDERACDVRILAATNRDLRADVAAGRFREDLYYRLAVVTLELPPLRARRTDVPQLVAHFLAEVAAEHGGPPRPVHPDAMAALEAYDWPGNVRELRNEVVRLALLSEGTITRELLAPRLLGEPAPDLVAPSPLAALEGRTLKEVLAEQERALLRAAMAAASGNKTRAARMLGVSWLGLSKKLQRFGISPGDP